MRASDITPRSVYESRRLLLQGLGAAALSAMAAPPVWPQSTRPGVLAPLDARKSTLAGAVSMDKLTRYQDASSYNNFYEFGTDKADPARNAHTLKTTPWTVEVSGLVKKPVTFGLDDLLKLSPLEERIYRLRCVEGWSMVIPWVG